MQRAGNAIQVVFWNCYSVYNDWNSTRTAKALKGNILSHHCDHYQNSKIANYNKKVSSFLAVDEILPQVSYTKHIDKVPEVTHVLVTQSMLQNSEHVHNLPAIKELLSPWIC